MLVSIFWLVSSSAPRVWLLLFYSILISHFVVRSADVHYGAPLRVKFPLHVRRLQQLSRLVHVLPHQSPSQLRSALAVVLPHHALIHGLVGKDAALRVFFVATLRLLKVAFELLAEQKALG